MHEDVTVCTNPDDGVSDETTFTVAIGIEVLKQRT